MNDSDAALSMAEQVVIGRSLRSTDDLALACAELGREHFYDQQHADVFEAVRHLYLADQPVNEYTVTKRFADAGRGVAKVLADLADAARTSGTTGYYIGEVRAAATARRRIELFTRGLNAAQQDNGDAIAQVLTDLAALNTTRVGRWAFIDGAAFVLDTPADVPAVWGDRSGRVLWAEGEALMVCGPSGVGKTTLIGQLIAARLGLLATVLGLRVTPGKRRVLYLACDRPRQIARSLNRTLRREWRETVTDRLVVWRGPPPQDFAQHPDLMLAMAQEAGADTLVVDSIKDVAVGISDDAVGAGYNRARQRTIAAGVEVIEAHHQVKRRNGSGPPNTLDDVYGSVWLTAGAGSVALLWGEPGDPVVRLVHLKQPAEEVGPFEVLHDHTTGLSVVHGQPDLVTIAARAPAGITAADAAKVLFETTSPSRAQTEKARRRLDKLATEGRLIAAKGRPGGPAGGGTTTYHATAEDTPDGR